MSKIKVVVGQLILGLFGSTAGWGQVVVFNDDFEDGQLSDQLAVHDYVFEKSGTFAPVSELTIEETGGVVRIAGEGTLDTAVVDGHGVGWIGQARSLNPLLNAAGSISAEATATINSHSISSGGGDAGFVMFLTIEFDRNNRVIYNLMQSVGLGGQRFVQMHLEESGDFKTCFGATEYCIPRSFLDGDSLQLRLDFDTKRRLARGFLDGEKVLERPFAGSLGEARVSLGVAVRAVGDTIDVSFDDLLITQSEGAPTDPAFTARVQQTGSHCASVLVKHSEPISGGEIGILYDPSIFASASVRAGRDLSNDAVVTFRDAPSVDCEGELSELRGVSAGWIHSLTGAMLPAGEHEVLRICFETAPTAAMGDCSTLPFVDCLGVPAAPVRNVVTNMEGKSVALVTKDGEACIRPEPPFQRGDANADSLMDISDPIRILGCLFSGADCGSCHDALDSNDDRLVDITDAVFLLHWRFLDGPAPPPPFGACGADATPDSLDDCEGFAPC
jgi:hypothetical protein